MLMFSNIIKGEIMTKTIQTFPVNERDEIVAQQGIGTASSSEKLTLFDNGNLLTYGINMSNSKSVITTNLLTAATVTTEYTYFTGTAGASFAITLPAASSSIDGMFITIVSSVLRASTTWTSTGATFVGVPASLSINTPIKLQYHHATLQWFVTA